MIEKRLFHSQQHTVLVPISSTVSLFSSFFFFPSPFFYLFLQPLEKRRRFFGAGLSVTAPVAKRDGAQAKRDGALV
jgi:hypothetical protein